MKLFILILLFCNIGLAKELLIKHANGDTELLKVHWSGYYNGSSTILKDTSNADVITQAERDAAQAVIDTHIATVDAAKALEDTEKAQIQNLDVDAIIDNMEKAKLKKILKWLIRKVGV